MTKKTGIVAFRLNNNCSIIIYSFPYPADFRPYVQNTSPFVKYRKGEVFCQVIVCKFILHNLFYGIDLVDEFHAAAHTVIGSGEGIVILGYGSGCLHTVDDFL